MKKYFVLKSDRLIREFSLKEFNDYCDDYYAESESQLIFNLIKEELYAKLGLNQFEKALNFKFYISDEESSTIRIYDIGTFLEIKTKLLEICK